MISSDAIIEQKRIDAFIYKKMNYIDQLSALE